MARPLGTAALLTAIVAVAGSLPTASSAEDEPDSPFARALKWRCIGPFRGGRVTAVAGVPGDPLVYYFGATGGGVFKTEDGGAHWNNITDRFLKTGSVGAIAVADGDPNVIYVGMGEAPFRGVTSSSGDGVYRSRDAGKTWEHVGLPGTRQISRIQIDPNDPDHLFVAAQGNPWAPSEERGVYRSRDGGDTWEQVLFVSERAGASDLSMNPDNPRVLYAAFWQFRRRPWRVESGGEESGIWRSTDDGDTWERLADGLPESMGKIGVAISPSRPERVFAMIEAEEGGLFRSDDGGDNWKRVNDERLLRARAWYYTHVFADPRDAETVYVLNAPMLKSIDGGKTFEEIDTPHGDNHALWINPDRNDYLINGNDGGANVSFDAGQSWSTQANQPTAQFYRVMVDERDPYRVYGGQQDNTTVAIASRTVGAGISPSDWHPVGGCECGFVAFDQPEPTRVYAGCYLGGIDEYDLATGHQRSIRAYPSMDLGSDAKDHSSRFNWNAPIVASLHRPGTIYHAAQRVLRTTDRGVSWQGISPDLTRDDEEKQGPGGVPFTNEAAGAEYYNTISYLVESPHAAGTLWVGTDDGRVHVTRDDGESWTDVTPPSLGEALVNCIEVSPHDPATAYLTVTRYKHGDFTPNVLKTDDFGQTWDRRVDGIPNEDFVRCVRVDPEREGLLYAGTETGVYYSPDDGQSWHSLQLELPRVPITDLAVHRGDLVAATQGRAFWILDDLSPLQHEAAAAAAEKNGDPLCLLAPRVATRARNPGFSIPSGPLGENPPAGATIHYWLSEAAVEDERELLLEVFANGADTPLRTLTSAPSAGDDAEHDDDDDEPEGSDAEGDDDDPRALPPRDAGWQRFQWDLRNDPIARVEGIFTPNEGRGYRVPPGEYELVMSLGERSVRQPLRVRDDPALDRAPHEFAVQQKLARELWGIADELRASIQRVRDVRDQVDDLLDRTGEHAAAEELTKAGDALRERLRGWEESVRQTKRETFQDVINFENLLDAQVLSLLGEVDAAGALVTVGQQDRLSDLREAWRERRRERDELLDQEVPRFNDLVNRLAVPAITVPTPAKNDP